MFLKFKYLIDIYQHMICSSCKKDDEFGIKIRDLDFCSVKCFMCRFPTLNDLIAFIKI